MKNVSSQMLAHLGGNVTTLCTCWFIERRDGQQFYFTDHDAVVSYGGSSHLPVNGFKASALTTDDKMSVDNMEVVGVLSSDLITDADLLAGLWDQAYVEVYLVKWGYPYLLYDRVILRTGTLGEIKTGRNQFTAEMRGLLQPLQQSVGRVYSPLCNADFGDSRCTYNYYSTTDTTPVTATVTSKTSQSLFTASSLTQAAGFFDYGVVEFSGGYGQGRQMEVRSFGAGGVIQLQMILPHTFNVGDSFTIRKGCDKKFSTCVGFGNAINFQGFPHIPGNDRLITGN